MKTFKSNGAKVRNKNKYVQKTIIIKKRLGEIMIKKTKMDRKTKIKSAKNESDKKELKIQLGIGYKKMKGFINVDINPTYKPDVLWDLTKRPWPFEDESVDFIYSAFCLEHLPVPVNYPALKG